MNTKFINKEEYLAYRSEWKAKYKELSQQIRDYKFCRWFRSLQEGKGKALSPLYPQWEKKFTKLFSKYGNRFYYVAPLKEEATQMLAELDAAKQEAQRQYLASKEKELMMA